MKRKKFWVVCIAVLVLISSSFTLIGCDLFGGGNSNDNQEEQPQQPKTYVIQYTDDAGNHQLSVTEGQPYALKTIPSRKGYTFAGLFDAQVGGTQYVSASGASLSPFTDGKSMVLFPQFTAKEYTVILDYQGAQSAGVRQFNVSYGSSLPDLPTNVRGEHKDFVGWYTEKNCGGTQVADEYGLVPRVSVLNDANFDLSNEYVYLYAGFEAETYTVTFCFKEGMDTEEVQVPYDTPIREVIPDTRVDGKAVLTWSKSQDGEAFNGKITDDIVLYAVEYAPVIELDTDGGNKVSAVVAREGATISLPTPAKDLAKFLYWEDKQGNRFASTVMPKNSITLKAVWQAKLVFDENGGSDVDDISVEAGNKITLPTPEKEGFIFAGWYTADKQQYTSTSMPTVGMQLKAGWYEIKKEMFTLIGLDANVLCYDSDFSERRRFKIDLSTVLAEIPNSGVTIAYKIHFRWRAYDGRSSAVARVALYEGFELNSAYELIHKSFSHPLGETQYIEESINGTSKIKTTDLYLYYASKASNIGSSNVRWHDMYVEIYYPDTANLYL